MVAQPGEPSLADCALSSAMRDNVVLDPRDALASSLLLALAWLLSTNTSVAESRDSRTYRSFEACVPFCLLFPYCELPCAWLCIARDTPH
ncbi:hypothetical protein ARMSODRAFT_160989 [Armillaria solidipes]|uniref:Uncharacterized protein n=1 Tax=Armillaria solidipes TaxID=1076256 RepID=A0A2H3BXS1_9AGAR|nr:hypothetical protein ARMSODRAFT_160989 [Armillaria solidipes]